MTYLALTFFHSLDVTAAGKRITILRSTRVQGLLVYLALEAHSTHERDRLAALL